MSIFDIIDAGKAFTTRLDSLETEAAQLGLDTSGLKTRVTTLEGQLRRDATVGERVIATIGGVDTMLYGDTGWRNIVDQIVNGWTCRFANICRTGNVVTLRIRKLDPANKTSPIFLTIPPGFRPAGSTYISLGVVFSGFTGDSSRLNFEVPVPTKSLWENGLQEISWVTGNPWPSTLPGAPA